MGRGFKPKPRDDAVPLNPMAVESLINPTIREWNHDLLQQLFDKESIAGISRITIPVRPTYNKMIWVEDPKGLFLVKSAYQVNQTPLSNVNNGSIWKRLWKVEIHDRIKMLIWRIGSGAFPTKKMIA